MKSIYEVLPMFRNSQPISESKFFKNLKSIPYGNLAQDLLLKCEAGMIESEFDWLMSEDSSVKAVEALKIAHCTTDEKIILTSLKSFAAIHSRIKQLDGTIPWEMYAETFPCLSLPSMEPKECSRSACREILTRHYSSVIEVILMRHEILSKEAGIFAERLITAIELGVPFERIKRCLGINLQAAIKTLKEYIPECSEEWLSNISKCYEEDWGRHRKT